jgi:hypothetical protein
MTPTPTPRGLGHHRGPRSGTRPRSGRPLQASRIPLTVVERRAGRLRSGDARAFRCCGNEARARRGSPSPRPASAGPDRDRDRPPRARSREALDRDRIRPTTSPDRPAPARRRRAPRDPPGGYSHRRRSHATPAMPPRRRGCRRRPPQLDAAPPRGRGAPVGARRSRRGGARRAAPVVASYVRVAVGSGSLQRLRDEESHYRAINESHRKHFAAIDVPLGSVGVAASTPPEANERLAPYQSALDLPIVRVLANSDATSLTAVADAAAP